MQYVVGCVSWSAGHCVARSVHAVQCSECCAMHRSLCSAVDTTMPCKEYRDESSECKPPSCVWYSNALFLYDWFSALGFFFLGFLHVCLILSHSRGKLCWVPQRARTMESKDHRLYHSTTEYSNRSGRCQAVEQTLGECIDDSSASFNCEEDQPWTKLALNERQAGLVGRGSRAVDCMQERQPTLRQ